MNAKTVARLYEVSETLKELTAEKKHLTELVLDGMLKEEASTYKTNHFTVSVGYRKSYEMPQWFRDQTEELKLAKKNAEKDAPVSKTPFLSFRAKDPKPAPEQSNPKGTMHI